MNLQRFSTIAARYPSLRIGVIGDICLDRYFDIDPARQEISIETRLPVHNIARVRCQPGAAGTILNNLAALGVQPFSVGLCGEDGEGWELERALARLPGTHRLVRNSALRTFTYTKPLVHRPHQPPEELSRLDLKNWDPTPHAVETTLLESFDAIAPSLHAVLVMDQVDVPDTGVVTRRVRDAVGRFAAEHPSVPVIADSRRGLRDWPPMIFKMNAAELAALTHSSPAADVATTGEHAVRLARSSGRPVFVSLSERGILAGMPGGTTAHAPALPERGPIDIVGAGDSVTANLACALAAGATVAEALEIAMAAASVVIHQLGTTGTATPTQIAELLPPA
jgi:rfaE bifunctional protein kinase chain/domain